MIIRVDKRHILTIGFLLIVLSSIPINAQADSASSAWMSRTDMEELTVKLASSDRPTRLEAAFTLRDIGQDALPVLMSITRHGSSAQRRGAVIGLTLLPQPSLGMETLFAVLADPDLTVRSFAAHGLALIGSPAASRLAALLDDEDTAKRDAAAFALTLMGTKAIPALTATLESPDIFARTKAAWLLGRMGHEARSAIPALIRALDTHEERTMHILAEAIDLIGPNPALVLQHLMLLGNHGSTLTGRLGGSAASHLVPLLKRPGTPLAQSAFRAIAATGTEAIPALRHAIATGPMTQKVAAALLLVEIDPRAVNTLPEDVRQTLSAASRQTK